MSAHRRSRPTDPERARVVDVHPAAPSAVLRHSSRCLTQGLSLLVLTMAVLTIAATTALNNKVRALAEPPPQPARLLVHQVSAELARLYEAARDVRDHADPTPQALDDFIARVHTLTGLVAAAKGETDGRHGPAQAPSEAAQLRELLAAHRHAAALLAHELRGPLATLGAASQSLELALAGTGEEIDAPLARMRRAICRLDELAGKFVTHERLARRMIDPQHEAVDLASLAHEVVAAMQPDTAHVLHIVPGAPAHGWCDRALCAEVLRNLIHNAVKYSPADQPVTIAFGRAPDGAVWISVADQGPGIAAEDLARVFDADYRGTPHRETRGTGQGLYLSRQICLRQGGNLEVDSTPGRGARFIMRLAGAPQPANT